MDKQSVEWISVLSQPFAENSYIVWISGKSECLVIDPGFEPDKLETAIENASLVPVAILNTHGHSDHIAGNARMKELWPNAPLIIGEGDAHKLTDPEQNLSAPFGVPLISPPADQTLQADEVWQGANVEFLVRETPGHSIGHVIFICKQHQPWVVFGGMSYFRAALVGAIFLTVITKSCCVPYEMSSTPCPTTRSSCLAMGHRQPLGRKRRPIHSCEWISVRHSHRPWEEPMILPFGKNDVGSGDCQYGHGGSSRKTETSE